MTQGNRKSMIPFTFEVKSDIGVSMYFGTSFKEAEEVYNKAKCSVIFFQRDSTGGIQRVFKNKYRPAVASIEAIMKAKKQ